MIGNAHVVALTEAVHAATEPLEFRNKLFRYLVEEKGFTAIAIESGVVESRAVYDYVLGNRSDLPATLAQGITWTFDQLPQNRELVEWMRDYNAKPGHARKIRFYGFDLSGSLNAPNPKRGGNVALEESLSYLVRVDAPAAASLHARLDRFLPGIRFYARNPADAPVRNAQGEAIGYERFTQPERDAISGAVGDLVALFSRNQARYSAASTDQEFAWGYRSALAARQSDEWLREVPLGWQPAAGMDRAPGFLSVAADVRDRAQADNIDWIVEQEGSFGKVLVFGARYHLSNAPLVTDWFEPEPRTYGRQAVSGTYLKERFGPGLVTIGNLVGEGKSGCGDFGQVLERAPVGSLERIAGELGTAPYVLDLRKAPTPVARWLQREQPIGQGGGVLTVAVGKAFDLLLYIDRVTPACAR
ncbi:MAG: erythromycin esterase family protein [Gammaproteobacteria bacterium]